MPQDRGADSDDNEQYTEADRNRISELFPRCAMALCRAGGCVQKCLCGANLILVTGCRDLTAAFVSSPQPKPVTVPHDQPLAVAGSDHRKGISLERMQV